MIRTKLLLQLAEYRLVQQTDEADNTCYLLENAATDQVIDGALSPDDLVSKMTHLANLKRLEVSA